MAAAAAAAGLTLLAAFVAVPSASADSSDLLDADTTANIPTGGGGSVPVIECGWALNDVDGNWDTGMQYGQDDEPLLTPGYPCQADGSTAVQTEGAGPMIHVLPNAHDEPTEVFIELWGAVTSNTTGTVVYWDVYHPDESFKVQVDGRRYASSFNAEYCGGPGGMFDAAVATGQMTTAARNNIVAECESQQKSLYYGAFGISKHQPYGEYTIVMKSFNPNGSTVELEYTIEVLSFYQLEKDFTSVHFGNVGSNSHWWQPIAGDFTWDGTDNAANQKTSVRNTGNAGIGLDVRFHSLCHDASPSCTEDKRIDQFDVKFGKTLAGLQSMGHTGPESALRSNLTSTAKPAPAGQWYSFDDNINRVLCPNDVAKIEFSIYTRNLQSGTYSATPGIGLRARPENKCPTDDGGVYLANGYTGNTPTSNNHWGDTGAVI